jgi:hypothetical protein
VTKRMTARFRTRIITQGVIPSLYVDYKSSRIKPYHKEGRALRTETTINNTRDFRVPLVSWKWQGGANLWCPQSARARRPDRASLPQFR